MARELCGKVTPNHGRIITASSEFGDRSSRPAETSVESITAKKVRVGSASAEGDDQYFPSCFWFPLVQRSWAEKTAAR